MSSFTSTCPAHRVCAVCSDAQSCPTLWDPMDCSPPGSSVHGISQDRILEWAAISFSRGSSQPRDRTQVFHIAGRFFTILYRVSHQGSFQFYKLQTTQMNRFVKTISTSLKYFLKTKFGQTAFRNTQYYLPGKFGHNHPRALYSQRYWAQSSGW